MSEKKGKRRIRLDKKTMDLINLAAEKTGKTPEQVVTEAIQFMREKYLKEAEKPQP